MKNLRIFETFFKTSKENKLECERREKIEAMKTISDNFATIANISNKQSNLNKNVKTDKKSR